MPYRNEEILRDKNGNPIPQLWDPAQQKFVPATTTQNVRLIGSLVREDEEKLEIRNTNEHIFDLPHGSEGVVEQSLFFFNNTGQTANIVIQTLFRSELGPINGGTRIVNEDVPGSNGKLILLPDTRDELEEERYSKTLRVPEMSAPVPFFRIRITYSAAPSTGALYILSMKRY